MPPDVASLLGEARKALAKADCETPALDARLLLQEAAGLTHDEIAADPARIVAGEAAERLKTFVARRIAHEPVSRIIGWREFYGRKFRVTPDVLDPRPDTETLVEAALRQMPDQARILDLGVGSGAIIVTLLAERRDCTGVATDLSGAALMVAGDNARSNSVADRLSLVQGPWFAPVTGRFDVIVSNPPYIPEGEIAHLSADVRGYDPRLALEGGADGLAAYRAIAAAARGHMEEGAPVLVEVGAGQADSVAGLFEAALFRCQARHRDLAGHVRVLGFVDGAQENHWKSPRSQVNGTS